MTTGTGLHLPPRTLAYLAGWTTAPSSRGWRPLEPEPLALISLRRPDGTQEFLLGQLEIVMDDGDE